MDEFVTITVDCSGDPDASKLQALLDADFAYQRARCVRDRWVCVLAVLCAVTWVGIGTVATAPGYPLAVFALSAVTLRTAVAGVIEQHRYRRWSGALRAHPGAVLRHEEEATTEKRG